VRLDDAKANLSLVSGAARWFKRVSVTIANGEEVGVLVPGEPQPEEEPAPDEELEAAVIAEIDRAWRVGEPYGGHHTCGERFHGRSLPRRVGAAASAASAAVAALLARGVIEEAQFARKKKGLRVVPHGERKAAFEVTRTEEVGT
jgi:hypothetical protein